MRTALLAIGMLLLGALLSRLLYQASGSSTSSTPLASTARGPGSGQEHQVEASSNSERSALPQAPAPVVETLSAPREAAGAAARGNPTSAEVLDLKDCLKDPELNPEGLRCPSAAVEEDLRRLIIELNERAITLDETRNDLVNQIAASKIASGLDPKETWDSYPDDLIRYRVMIGRLADGAKTTGSTAILVGERPELEDILTQITDSRLEARAKIKDLIAALCVH